MPTHLHEVVAMLFRDFPDLVVELLGGPLGLPLPADIIAEVAEANLSEAKPLAYQADRLVILRRPAHEPMLAVVVEVQREPDEDKQWSWPCYLTQARQQYRSMAAVLVVATTQRTATRAREPIRLDPVTLWAPFVIDPGMIPRIEDPEVARARPAMAVLSALAHRDTEADAAVLRAVWIGQRGSTIDAKLLSYLWDVIESGMGQESRQAWEKFMQMPEGYQFQGETARKNYGLGLEDGQQKALRSALLRVLAKKGIALTEAQADLVAACSSTEILDRWLERALDAQGAAAVFETDNS